MYTLLLQLPLQLLLNVNRAPTAPHHHRAIAWRPLARTASSAPTGVPRKGSNTSKTSINFYWTIARLVKKILSTFDIYLLANKSSGNGAVELQTVGRLVERQDRSCRCCWLCQPVLLMPVVFGAGFLSLQHQHRQLSRSVDLGRVDRVTLLVTTFFP